MTVFQNVRKGLIPARLSVVDVYALTESGVFAHDDKFELVDGEIVPMAAAKASPHIMMEGRLIHALVPALTGDARMFPAPSLTLAEDLLLEPDFAVWPKTMVLRDVRGPDLLLVIEVSDSSLAYDLRVKASLYARSGVREYWVVDAVRRTIRVHRAPIKGVYDDVEEYEAHDTVSALLLPGVAVRLDTLD